MQMNRYRVFALIYQFLLKVLFLYFKMLICYHFVNNCFRYTDRKQSAINHFNQALSMDPLLWAAYEELCILGMCGEY